jgi:hypothetical protein
MPTATAWCGQLAAQRAAQVAVPHGQETTARRCCSAVPSPARRARATRRRHAWRASPSAFGRGYRSEGSRATRPHRGSSLRRGRGPQRPPTSLTLPQTRGASTFPGSGSRLAACGPSAYWVRRSVREQAPWDTRHRDTHTRVFALTRRALGAACGGGCQALLAPGVEAGAVGGRREAPTLAHARRPARATACAPAVPARHPDRKGPRHRRRLCGALSTDGAVLHSYVFASQLRLTVAA